MCLKIFSLKNTNFKNPVSALFKQLMISIYGFLDSFLRPIIEKKIFQKKLSIYHKQMLEKNIDNINNLNQELTSQEIYNVNTINKNNLEIPIKEIKNENKNNLLITEEENLAEKNINENLKEKLEENLEENLEEKLEEKKINSQENEDLNENLNNQENEIDNNSENQQKEDYTNEQEETNKIITSKQNALLVCFYNKKIRFTTKVIRGFFNTDLEVHTKKS